MEGGAGYAGWETRPAGSAGGLRMFVQPRLSKPFCEGTVGTGSIANIVNPEGVWPDYEIRRKTAAGGQRF